MRRRISGFWRLEPGHILPVFAVLLEVLWAYLWLAWIGKWQSVGWDQTPLSLAGAIGLALAAEVVSRFSLTRSWSVCRVRLVTLSTLLILLAVLIRVELGGGYALWDAGWGRYALGHLSPLVGGLVFGAYLLWRGVSIGRESLSFDDLYHKFLIGLTALGLLLVLRGTASGTSEFRQAVASTGRYVIAYFSVGLLALAIANLQSIQEEMLRHHEVSRLFYRRWLPLLLVVVLGIVAVSVGIASAFSFDLVRLLLQPLNVMANWLLFAFVYAIGVPLGIVAAGLIYVLRFLIHLLGGAQPPQQFTLPDFSDLRQIAEGQEGRGLPAEAMLALKWGLVALVVLIVLFILARALFRYGKGEAEDEIEEVDESLWSWQGFKADLRSLMIRVLKWFRRSKPATPAAVAPPNAVTQGDSQDRLFTVREIYQGLLWEGRRAGQGRREAETPYEYEGRLKALLEMEVLEIQAITQAYVAERYGDADIPKEQLGLLNRLWQRLRSKLFGDVNSLKEGG